MFAAAYGLGTLFAATDASESARYAALIPFCLLCSAYIAYHMAREEHPQPIRRALRKAREERNRESR